MNEETEMNEELENELHSIEFIDEDGESMNNEDLDSVFEATVTDIDERLESLTELFDNTAVETNKSLYFVTINTNGYTLFAGVTTSPEKTDELIENLKELFENESPTFTIQENILFKKN